MKRIDPISNNNNKNRVNKDKRARDVVDVATAVPSAAASLPPDSSASPTSSSAIRRRSALATTTA